MIGQEATGGATAPVIPPALRCLLIVWRCPEHLQRLRAILDQLGVETIYCTSPLEVCCACEQEFDLAIVDVEPRFLPGILTTMRGSNACAEIPVWVESSRLYEDAKWAGVLSPFRAMPCNIYELTKLIHLRLASAVALHHSRSL